MQDIVRLSDCWAGLARRLVDWHVGVSLWRERRRGRLALRTLDDRMLADICLARAEVDAEVGKPFWLG
ncbi:MAG: DUF1127 domain-containing protein [Alphaproteobacteria bacterium]|nr:DUF1127 domain-containing protein [Alphaproteobacteria bacterium]